jgi:hypothetical protein
VDESRRYGLQICVGRLLELPGWKNLLAES